MPAPRHLSKSRYCVGLQCLRRLWWEVHEPEAPELRPDDDLRAVFERGHRIGVLARGVFPGGTLVDLEPWRVRERVEATRAAIDAGAPAIYEASFAAAGVFAAVDILQRLHRGGWALVEVKSTFSVKEQFIPDVAIQLHAARASGLEVPVAQVMHVDPACAASAVTMFRLVDVTAAAEALLPDLPAQVTAMREALDGRLPDVPPGARCGVPYTCPFLERCFPSPRVTRDDLADQGAHATCQLALDDGKADEDA